MEILCFFAGIAFFFTKSLYLLLLIAFSLIIKPNWRGPLCFLLAILWSLAHGWLSEDKGMPQGPVLHKVLIEGQIVSIPQTNPNKTQFDFLVHSLNEQPVRAKVSLACYQYCPTFKLGETWRFQAKLKKPQNLGNPGSFDYVGHLQANHIHWTGYIKKGSLRLQQNIEKSVLSIREKLAHKLDAFAEDKAIIGIIQALTLGVTGNIPKELWDLFRRTGTTHLMVISGSHIGLVAGFVYFLMRFFYTRYSRFSLYFPAARAASIFACLAASFYAVLAGFSPPAQRALFACFVLFLNHFLNRRLSGWQAWRYGLLAVLLYEPHCVLLPGFYLSFLAVAIIFLSLKRFYCSSLTKIFLMQGACLLGLMPITLYFFSYGSVTGFVANLIAIPVVSFLLVPLSLSHLLFLHFFDFAMCIIPLRIIIHNLLIFLHFIDNLSAFNFSFTFSSVEIPILILIGIFSLFFLPIYPVLLGLSVVLFTQFFPQSQKIHEGDLRVHVMDVGQGLAVVVRTAKHTLVYDTGMKFFGGGDMGNLVLIPFFNKVGIKKLDKVVISHPDLDHRGGLPTLEAKYSIEELLVDKVKFYHRGKSCHSYPGWEWDGVKFSFLTISKKFRTKNNSSCVLKIENSAGRMLLTGDIEKMAESYLISTFSKDLEAEILVVPHHGSKTSSSTNFIQTINPKYAIISYGFDNRYRFPHIETLNTLTQNNSQIFKTAECGMVTFQLEKKNRTITSICFNNSTALI